MPRPTKRNQYRGNPEQMSPDRESWVDLGRFQALLFDGSDSSQGDPDADDTSHGGDLPQYKISIRFPGKMRPTTLNLVALTVPELDALEAFFIRAFDLVRPVCAELDERAKTAFEEGDETYVRLYRPVPQLHVRKRQEREQRQGLQERSDRPVEVHDSDGQRRGIDNGANSSSLSDEDAREDSTKNDPA